MSRTIRGTDRQTVRKVRKQEKQTRQMRQEISRANGR